jgi:hypothetical protein
MRCIVSFNGKPQATAAVLFAPQIQAGGFSSLLLNPNPLRQRGIAV